MISRAPFGWNARPGKRTCTLWPGSLIWASMISAVLVMSTYPDCSLTDHRHRGVIEYPVYTNVKRHLQSEMNLPQNHGDARKVDRLVDLVRVVCSIEAELQNASVCSSQVILHSFAGTKQWRQRTKKYLLLHVQMIRRCCRLAGRVVQFDSLGGPLGAKLAGCRRHLGLATTLG